MELILIRHPAPQIAPGICYGSTDLPLQPGANEVVLAKILPALSAYPRTTPIWTSPLQRATGLANALAQARQQTLHVDADLREMDFGAWEMCAWDAIARQEIDAWAASPCHYHPGGGENVLQMSRRVICSLRRIRQVASAQQARAAIVVCHAGSMRVMLAWQQLQSRLSESISEAEMLQIAQIAVDWPAKFAYGQLCIVQMDDVLEIVR